MPPVWQTDLVTAIALSTDAGDTGFARQISIAMLPHCIKQGVVISEMDAARPHMPIGVSDRPRIRCLALLLGLTLLSVRRRCGLLDRVASLNHFVDILRTGFVRRPFLEGHGDLQCAPSQSRCLQPTICANALPMILKQAHCAGR
jgi:hypothetical protein